MLKASRIVSLALLGILGAFLFVSFLSSQNISVRALDFNLRVAIHTQGYSELAIPPLGSVRAKTHNLPLKFIFSLVNINLEQLRTLVSENNEDLIPQLVASFRIQARLFIVKIMLLALLGGFSVCLFVFRKCKPALAGGAIGLAALGIFLGGTLITYDESAFIEPEFHGIVEIAPWLLGVAEEALVAVTELDSTLRIVATNLVLMFDSLGQLAEAEGAGTGLTILHVSDIHNNPLAVTLANQAAVAFGVDFVIDTGDITDYGTPLEADLASTIAETGLPWYFVPGNHDSPAVIEVLQELANVTVLKEDVVYLEQFDFCLAGIADPSASDYGMGIPTKEQYRETAKRLADVIAHSRCQPVIIAAHHPLVLEEFTDRKAVFLHGHSHRASIEYKGSSVFIDAGTTGGAGIRGLISTAQIPYTMVLLHLERKEAEWQAVAADFITINQINASFTLERKLLAIQSNGPELPEIFTEDTDE